MSAIIEWSDGLAPRSRRPWLLFIREDDVIPFEGRNITGVAAIRGTDFKANGKWSYTMYRLRLADGIRHIAGHSGWETGRFVEGLGAATHKSTPDTWAEVAAALGVSVPSAMEFLRTWRPKAAEKLDETERTLSDLEESEARDKDAAVSKVTVSFGAPTAQQERCGFWESPKPIPGFKAEIRLIGKGGWSEGNIRVVGMSGTVLDARHSSGMHGGYCAVIVAVMPGTETEIPPFRSSREKAAKASGLPEDLWHAFDGDENRIREFMSKVDRLDPLIIDEHEFSCGRARKRAELIRVSGDEDFFLGADPLEVCEYIRGICFPETESPVNILPGFNGLGDVLAKIKK